MAHALPHRAAPRRFLLWLGGTVSVALAGWGAVAAAQYGLDRWHPPPPPIAEQLTLVVRDAARSGLRVAESYQVDLHGSGARSRILVLRRAPDARTPIAEELRIYDVVDGRLRLRFRFAPQPAGSGLNPEIHIRLGDVADLDSNGSTEIIAALDETYVEHDTSAPTLVGWDPLTDTYRIAPLLTPDNPKLGGSTRPRIAPHRRQFILQTPPDLFVTPIKMRDPTTGVAFRSFAAKAFVVQRSKFANHLLAAFDVGAERSGPVFQLNAWSIADLSLPPLLYRCVRYDGEAPTILFRTRDDESIATALRRIWAKEKSSLNC